MGTIFNIQRFCLHDGDGIRTNVFFKGCPLRCIWCHNPEGLTREVSVAFNAEKCVGCGSCTEFCPGRTLSEGKLVYDRKKCVACGKCTNFCLYGANEMFGKEMSADEVMEQVLKDRVYYKTSGGGVTLSGGEPSMQAEFAIEIIDKAYEEGISICMETCGIGSADFYRKAAEKKTVFLFDMKCIDPEKHKKLTGVDNKRIIENLKMLFEMGADVIIRMPMIPDVNDSVEDIEGLCAFLKAYEGSYRYAEIMPYHAFGTAKAERLGYENTLVRENATSEDKERWERMFLDNGIQVKISK